MEDRSQKELSAVEQLLRMHAEHMQAATPFDAGSSKPQNAFVAALVRAKNEAHQRASEAEALAKKARQNAEEMDKLVATYMKSS
ncbi:exocyst complex component 5 [Colletotrichum sp. SAR11_59]|nr:exocyst complex component 5 [Colletotrichum sp. SAR11_59]